jgi:PmbA protein
MDYIELEKAAREILGSIDKGDVVASFSESTPIDYDMDQLKSIEDIGRSAIGLRVFKDGRVGNSFINSLSDTAFIKDSALQSASLGDSLDLELPGAALYPDLGMLHPEVMGYTKEEGIKLGNGLVARLKSIDPKAKVNTAVSRSYSKHFLANTSGFSGNYEESHFGVSAGLQLVDDDESLLFVGDSDTSLDLNLDLDCIYKNIEWRYKNALTKTGVKTGYFPVIFTPDALDLLLEPIELAANGKTLYKGISVLGDKLGQKIGSDAFSITDDPHFPGAVGSYPFDDEGIVPSKLPVVENGVFRNFIFDLASAKRLGKKSTGHGSRSVSSLPSPSFSNLIISTGNTTLEEMIASVDYGLIVYEFLGGGMSNVLAGDFSVNIELGYLIEKGKIKGRVKNTMLSGNVYELLQNILSIENKHHKIGSLYAPHMLFDRVSMAG